MFKNIITKLLYCLVELLLILYPQLCALINIKTIIFGLQNYFELKPIITPKITHSWVIKIKSG